MHTQPRPLLIAEAANPEWVSVPLVGWSLARAIQRDTGAHIVTQIRNREAFLRAGLSEGSDFTAIDTEVLMAPAWKLAQVLRMGDNKGWTMVAAIQSLTYPYFERRVWQQFEARIASGEFNIVHRITPLSPTAVSPIAARCQNINVPFVVGPLNGGVAWPKGFDAERRKEREWLSYVRSAFKILPGRKRALKATSAVLAGSRATQAELPEFVRRKSVYIPENAVDPERFSATARPGPNRPLRACFVGRMVPYKGPDMLLDAAAPLLKAGKMTLDFVGDGPLMPDLRAFVDSENLRDSVRFHGWLQHRDVQDVLSRCDILPFPSVREFGGGVVLEAMALGVVPIVVDYAGPGELVTSDTGYRVPLGSRAEIIAAFSRQLAEICGHSDRLAPLAQAAQNRIQALYTWPVKARQVQQVYEWVLADDTQMPTFEFRP